MLLPQMVVQDGYFVSHIAGEVEMPAAAQVDAYLPPVPAAVPARPAPARSRTARRSTLAGAAAPARAGPGDGGRDTGHPGEDRRVRARRSAATTPTSSRSTGSTTPTSRSSSPAGTRSPAGPRSRMLRERGVKIGMARLLWIRPFPSEDLRAALRGDQGRRGGGDQPGPGRVDLRRHPRPGRDHRPVPRGGPAAGDLVHGYSLGGETVPAAEFEWMVSKLTRPSSRATSKQHWVGSVVAPRDDPGTPT